MSWTVKCVKHMSKRTATAPAIPIALPLPDLMEHCLDARAVRVFEHDENFATLQFRILFWLLLPKNVPLHLHSFQFIHCQADGKISKILVVRAWQTRTFPFNSVNSTEITRLWTIELPKLRFLELGNPSIQWQPLGQMIFDSIWCCCLKKSHWRICLEICPQNKWELVISENHVLKQMRSDYLDQSSLTIRVSAGMDFVKWPDLDGSERTLHEMSNIQCDSEKIEGNIEFQILTIVWEK
jgi:hypothetical protein